MQIAKEMIETAAIYCKVDAVRKLVHNLNATYEALTYKAADILPIELVQRDKLKYRKED